MTKRIRLIVIALLIIGTIGGFQWFSNKQEHSQQQETLLTIVKDHEILKEMLLTDEQQQRWLLDTFAHAPVMAGTTNMTSELQIYVTMYHRDGKTSAYTIWTGDHQVGGAIVTNATTHRQITDVQVAQVWAIMDKLEPIHMKK